LAVKGTLESSSREKKARRGFALRARVIHHSQRTFSPKIGEGTRGPYKGKNPVPVPSPHPNFGPRGQKGGPC